MFQFLLFVCVLCIAPLMVSAQQLRSEATVNGDIGIANTGADSLVDVSIGSLQGAVGGKSSAEAIVDGDVMVNNAGSGNEVSVAIGSVVNNGPTTVDNVKASAHVGGDVRVDTNGNGQATRVNIGSVIR